MNHLLNLEIYNYLYILLYETTWKRHYLKRRLSFSVKRFLLHCACYSGTSIERSAKGLGKIVRYTSYIENLDLTNFNFGKRSKMLFIARYS